MPGRLWIVGAVVLGLVAGGAAFLLFRSDDQTSFAWAVDHSPAGTQRLSWTDWAAVRTQEEADLTERSSAADVRRFLDRAFDDDLSPASALVTSAPVLQERFGFSPATADWELFSQSDQGAVVMRERSARRDLVGAHSRAVLRRPRPRRLRRAHLRLRLVPEGRDRRGHR